MDARLLGRWLVEYAAIGVGSGDGIDYEHVLYVYALHHVDQAISHFDYLLYDYVLS